MRENELIEYITKLEIIFDQSLSDKQVHIWVERFCDYNGDDFGRAVERIIRTRERFPRIATIYAALNEVGADSGSKKLRPAKPFHSYQDEIGSTCVWWNRTGQASGNDNPADDAPTEFEHHGRLFKLIDIADDEDSDNIQHHFENYREQCRKRDELIADLIEKIKIPEYGGLDEEETARRKEEILSRHRE